MSVPLFEPCCAWHSDTCGVEDWCCTRCPTIGTRHADDLPSTVEHRADVATVRRHLLELPELYALMPLFVVGTNGGGEERTATTSPARPPADMSVLDLLDTREKPDTDPFREDWDLDRRAGSRRQGVLPTLRSWARRVDAELWDADVQHEALAEVVTVLGDAGFLAAHLEWAAAQSWFGGLAVEVETLRKDMRMVMRELDPVPLVCTSLTCRWRVEPMDNRSWFRCTGCDRTWSSAEVIRLYEGQFPMHLSDCARALERPLRTLQRWVKDGWIKPVGRDTGGALFRVVDVQGAALNVARSAQAVPEKSA